MLKRLIQIIGIMLFLYMAYVVFYNFNHKETPTTQSKPIVVTEQEPVIYRQDPQLIKVLDELGLEHSKLNLIFGSNPAFSESKSASFTQPNTIYLSPSIDPSELSIALSHEYMHYVQVIDPKAQAFIPYVSELYRGNTWLYNRMSWYRINQTCENCLTIEEEAQSVACTEMNDWRLQQDFINWCNSHLPKRYSLL